MDDSERGGKSTYSKDKPQGLDLNGPEPGPTTEAEPSDGSTPDIIPNEEDKVGGEKKDVKVIKDVLVP